MGVVVVGVDGSKNSEAALDFAVGEARMRGDQLQIVVAWHIPPVVIAGIAAEAGFYQSAAAESRSNAQDIGAAAAARVSESAPSVKHEIKILMGPPAQVLLEQAKGASLLVVGARGAGGFAGLLLGSASQQVVQHAPCPVVVVPVPAD
jgi:nucleotide-binding universal stress UspA family protein